MILLPNFFVLAMIYPNDDSNNHLPWNLTKKYPEP
jgi:hypothetical protein